jgi:hypothetical protein
MTDPLEVVAEDIVEESILLCIDEFMVGSPANEPVFNFGYSFPEQILGACISGHLFCCQSGSLHQGAPRRLD